MMQLKQLLEKKGAGAVTVAASVSVGAAIQTMYKHRVGSVVIQADSGMPIGILTERDIMCLCAEGKTDFENMSLKDCMTTELVVGKPEDKVPEVLGIMTARRFRHMPVVKDGQLVGLVSIGDLVKATLEETAQEAEALRNYITS
jgi:CBS domain-containing protein